MEALLKKLNSLSNKDRLVRLNSRVEAGLEKELTKDDFRDFRVIATGTLSDVIFWINIISFF